MNPLHPSQPAPLLTIAVPTYNRSASLRRSLGALVSQIAEVPDGWKIIELMVSDNCSTDDTPEVIESFKIEAPLLHRRNAQNLGMEGNLIACFEHARGIHVWTFSDDDLLIDGALARIMQLLATRPVDLIYLPAQYLYGELDTFPSKAVDFRLSAVSDEEFALRANGVLSFLSSVIVNKQRYIALRQSPDLRRYQGTFLAHYAWIYTLLAYGQSFYICTRPVICARTGATGGYDLFSVFGEHYVRIGKETLAHKPRIRRILEQAMLYIHIPGFIARCRENSFGKFQYAPERVARQILDSYGASAFYCLVIRTQIFAGNAGSARAFRASRILATIWSLSTRLLCRTRTAVRLTAMKGKT